MKHTAPNPLGSPLPLAAAPMAGGPTTPRLAAAVAEAGACAFLAGGYKTPEALAPEIAQVRPHGAAFGVNLFVPNTSPIDEAEFRRYARELQAEADHYGLDLSRAPLLEDDDRWQHKLDLLLADPVPVVSVTFGLPRPAEVAALRRAGSQVLATVTTVEEARAAADVGADALVVQGSDAGGHSGTHDPSGRSPHADRAAHPGRHRGDRAPGRRRRRGRRPAGRRGPATRGRGSRGRRHPAVAHRRERASRTHKTHSPIPASPTPWSPGRSRDARPARCATGSPTDTTRPPRPGTPRSTT